MIQSPILPTRETLAGEAKFDRLSVFLSAFPLVVRLAHPAEAANLFLLATHLDDDARHVVFCASAVARPSIKGQVVAAAVVDFGGDSNPLLRSLPAEVQLETKVSEPIWALAGIFLSEASDRRCGAPAALARLGELLVLMVIRHAFDRGSADPGLLAGLSDKRLRLAVGALLDHPERDWRVEDLADLCALSRSQFMLSFKATLGMTPGTFMTAWRLTLARRRLQLGERVKTVAAASGYRSAAAFSRAYTRAFGQAPAMVERVGPETASAR
jgi:AraC-like DNA-binding protein